MHKRILLLSLVIAAVFQVSAANVIPFSETFDTQENFNKWLVINSNNDFYKWKYKNQSAYLQYNSSRQQDDWLLSPELELEAGVTYILTYSVNSGYDIGEGTHERMAIAYGEGDNPLTYSFVMPTREYAYTENKMVEQPEVTFTPSKSGLYRVGFYNTSPEWTNGVYLDNISIKEDTKKSAPNAVTDFKVVADAKGALTANGSFKAPTTSADGSELTTIDSILVKRGDLTVSKFEKAAPGQEYSFHDEVPLSGKYAYSAVAYNVSGPSVAANDTIFIGQDIPLDPTNVKIKDNLDGTLTLSWNAPGDKGANGNYVNVNELQYIIYDVNEQGYPTPRDTVSTNSYIVKDFDNTGAQNWLYFGVASLTNAGHSTPGAQSEIYIKGDPVHIPFIESFVDAKPEREEWWKSVEGFSFDNESADEDNGSARFISTYKEQVADLNTGKISIKGASNPKLLFKYYANPGKDVKLNVYVNHNYQTLANVASLDFKNLTGEAGWRQESIDLSQFNDDKGYVMVRFIASAATAGDTVRIDDIHVEDVLEYNVAVKGIDAPKTVKLGDSAEIHVKVANTGDNIAENFTVSLYANEKLVDTKTVANLDAFTNQVVEFNYKPNALSPETVALKAVAAYELDFDDTDNEATSTIKFITNDFPTATDLAAEETSIGTTLNWKAPKTTVRSITDDFENFKPWSIENFGKWTVVDNDKQPTNGLGVLPHDGEPKAFQAFYSGAFNLSGSNATLASHSGDMCLVCWDNDISASKAKNDDWLISPELSGNTQIVSIYAKGMSDKYGYEKFEFLYSTTDNKIESFTNKFGDTQQVSSFNWTKYGASLPEGAKYFAIHVISEMAYALMLDDASYEAAAMKIKGYNIYRDGELIATVGSDSTTFEDTEKGDHFYNVSVVYDDGESAKSNDAITIVTGINAVRFSNEVSPIYNLSGQRVSNSYRGLVIVNGKKILKK